jgi:hypothetical protein
MKAMRLLSERRPGWSARVELLRTTSEDQGSRRFFLLRMSRTLFSPTSFFAPSRRHGRVRGGGTRVTRRGRFSAHGKR